MESRSEKERYENGIVPKENKIVLAIIALQALVKLEDSNGE